MSHEPADVLSFTAAEGAFAHAVSPWAAAHPYPAPYELCPGQAAAAAPAGWRGWLHAGRQIVTTEPAQAPELSSGLPFCSSPWSSTAGSAGRSLRAPTCRFICFCFQQALADSLSIGAFRNVSHSQGVFCVMCSVLPALFELRLGTPFAFQNEG